MKAIIYFPILTLLLACSSNEREKIEDAFANLPPLETPLLRNDGKDAERFSSVDELLMEFNTSQVAHDQYELNLWLGAHFIYQKDFDSALYYYQSASQIDSTLDYKIPMNQAICYSGLGDFHRALKLVNKSIKMCGGEVKTNVLSNKAYYLGKLDSCEKAIELGLIVAQMDSSIRVNYGNLIICFEKLNETDSLKKYLKYFDEHFEIKSEKLEMLKRKYL